MSIELRVWVHDGTIPAGRDEQVVQKLRDHTLKYADAPTILRGMVETAEAEHEGSGKVVGSIWPCQCAQCLPPDDFVLKVAGRAYNKGFRDAGGEADDVEPMENWERTILTKLIEEAREK